MNGDCVHLLETKTPAFTSCILTSKTQLVNRQSQSASSHARKRTTPKTNIRVIFTLHVAYHACVSAAAKF